MVMKINRNVEWTYWKEHSPADEREMVGLLGEILLSDIVGVEIPEGCTTVRAAYETLKAQGETLLDGQVLSTLWDKRCIQRTPLWKYPEFSYYSYAIFAGVLIDFRVNGWHKGFPTLYCEQNSPKIAMLGLDEPLSDEGVPDGFGGTHRSYFAVKRRT